MRKRNSSHHLYYEASRMCFDDVKEIYDIMCQQAQKVEISYDQYDFDDFSEFANFAKKHQSRAGFELRSRGDNFVTFTFSSNAVSFRCPDDGTYSYLQVDKILKEAVPAIYGMLDARSFISLFFAGLILSLIGTTISHFVPAEIKSVLQPLAVLLLLTTLLAGLIVQVLTGIYPRIKFEYVWIEEKKEKRNFFSRNRDQILLQGISASFGAVVGSLVTYFLT